MRVLCDYQRAVKGWSFEDLKMHLRVSAIAAATGLEMRYRRFKRWPYPLATTVDPEAPLSHRMCTMDCFFNAGKCCLGHTAGEIRGLVGLQDVRSEGVWSEFWHSCFESTFEAMDICTNDVEGLHASHAKLLEGGHVSFI